MTEQDWEAVREIYLQGIATGNATFETSVPDYEEWDERHLADLPTHRALREQGPRLGRAESSLQPSCLRGRRRGEHLHR